MTTIDLSFEEECLTLKRRKFTLEQTAKEFKITSRTVMRRLKKKGLRWSELGKRKKVGHTTTQTSQTNKSKSSNKKGVVNSAPVPLTSQTINNPSRVVGNHPPATPLSIYLPKSIQALINLGPALKNIPSWLGPFIVKEIGKTSVETSPKWTRPPVHHSIQNAAIDEICYGKKHVIMIDGPKRRGKTSTVFTAFCECQYNDTFKRWFLYGATQDNARKIMRGMKEDPLFVQYTSPLYHGWGSADKLTMYNQGRIEVMASGSERMTSGTDADVIWIDESHSVLIKNPKTFAMAAMVLLARDDMKFIFTMNREGEAYEYFKNEMLNNYPEDDLAYFTFDKSNCPHISKEADKRVRTLVNASAGEEYSAQFLDNQYIREGGLYYPASKIVIAYKPYIPPKLEQFDSIGCGVDWGDNHDTAFHIGGFLGDEMYELESIYKQHPSSEELERIFVRLIREYPGIVFIWETSPLGSFARNSIRRNYPKQRFIDSTFTKHKQHYLDNLFIWLVDEEIHLKDGKLKRQIRSFINDKKNDDGHDALCHLLYKGAQPRTRMKIIIKPVMI